MITAGRFSSWFKTPVGESAGVIELRPDGTVGGGDATFSYTGHWRADGERVRGLVSAKRFAPGPPGVFGLDEIDIVATGYSKDGQTISGTGFARQTPGIKMEVTLVRMK
ncbi:MULTISPECIES: hypothetical protein [Bradyrhizobium]|jgi:hypothetical protein|uniref:T3SS negative regulator,GrlR n=2 Tax=Bradyrhizobium TaxID=374 RepID=A0ABY0Q9D0_9BRAD|nr:MULTISPECIES: hypothetical protein [Bradyrhizobium]SDJ73320.1 hypothetical protein SAMN05444163_6298 [Bradyrhizobium ottawaense]SEC19511.1 hypothetical protein SAMN05444171_0861 [Bradyrhizobium lablabi]